MAKPVVAQKGPYEVALKQGQRYLWCSCGLSKTQPECDATHKGSEFSPQAIVVEKNETVFLCGCKQTGNPPFCDGTHSTL
ncbi:MAG: CDGSH iron-sulfur domain-containing protein [Rhodospirillales bacterium]|nr:CDGSH iron-sulfur domain-containing protein [Rhodospirillales bacterium]